MHVLPRNVLWLLVGLLIAGCASQRVVPDELEPLVDRTVTFAEVIAAPESYQGRVLVLGGEVLKAKRLKDGTQIELLQLPLNKDERPILDRQQSQGRFFAIQPKFLDPATIVAGTKMTIVGEVSGAKTDHLDDVEYRYPVVTVKHLHTWQEQSQEYIRPRPGFSFGIFGGTGFGGGRGGLGIGF
ncbi:MAG: putative Outer membrane lipoprotein, Slp family [Candidatus Nitrospira kreftii]|uniref:Putative Outer membrane lipoprotein, Slp family n=1 Tax=Candidatus Nitrospira kreftii TaxID=2652173 RepID=A0A7S8J0H8_9BACT|nr:MAG: putative Outer membrane lipoprotein, Slp family [Candidatus Nitrospira kreftii]